MSPTWKEQLHSTLLQQHGNKKALRLIDRYREAFPAGYVDQYSIETAVSDINNIENLSKDKTMGISLQEDADKAAHLHVRLYQNQDPISISDFLHILENLGLYSNIILTHQINPANSPHIWIYDFVFYAHPSLQINQIKDIFEEAFINIYYGISENDEYNKLILAAALSWQEVMILRAYANYLQHLGFSFTRAIISAVLDKNIAITKDLIALFDAYHNPANQYKFKKQSAQIEQKIYQKLNAISDSDENKILFQFYNLIKNTLRTNFFKISLSTPDIYLSVKFDSQKILNTDSRLSPLYEVFIYSPKFEAIHMRQQKISRGGIFITEQSVGLRNKIAASLKSEVMRNAHIVPSGAKGGIILKNIHGDPGHYYSLFLRGLLDITDNFKNNKLTHPDNVICHDDYDPYLVVDVDRGTETFQEIANSIAREYGFWLGDSFASAFPYGPANKMAEIVACGVWESIKRHFQEINIDALNTELTVIGIGNMNEGVFGSSMVHTKHIKLIAAFNHKHIFVDPDPDPKVSYYERIRLLNLSNVSWGDYNTQLLSKGGGVFECDSQFIPLTKEIQRLLGIQDEKLSPRELIRSILKIPADLLLNGGNETYIKASSENQLEAERAMSEKLYVNGCELQSKVAVEGGNSCFTQAGRVEYALKGGLINTDFIDNSAGRDYADHETNLQIIFNSEIQNKNISPAECDQLFLSIIFNLSELVLRNNYAQNLLLGYSVFNAEKNIGLHIRFIKELESQRIFDRNTGFFSDEKYLLQRKAPVSGLTKPELAVLLAYAKLQLRQEIGRTKIIDDSYYNSFLEMEFPSSVYRKFKANISNHYLRREIITTIISNKILNEMGVTFVYQLQSETGAEIEEILKSYIIASTIFRTDKVRKLISSLDNKIATNEQYEMLNYLNNLIIISTRWFLRDNHFQGDLLKTIKHYSDNINLLEDLIPDLMGGETKAYLQVLTDRFLKDGLSKDMARRIATYRAIYTALNIVEVSTKYKFDLIQTAKVYFEAGERLNLLWFRDYINKDTRQDYWNTMARLTLRDELDIAQRALTIAIMTDNNNEANASKLIEHWINNNQQNIKHWDRFLSALMGSNNIDYYMLFICVREFLRLIVQVGY